MSDMVFQLLYQSELKIHNAEYHFVQLKKLLNRFLKQYPYTYRREIDPETGDDVFFAVIEDEELSPWGLIIGDIVHNLRSGLEYIAQACVAEGGGDVEDRYISFPYFNPRPAKRTDISSAIRGNIHGASDASVRFIKHLQPYKGFNPMIEGIFSLARTDKHHMLTPVIAMMRQVVFPVREIRFKNKPRVKFVAQGVLPAAIPIFLSNMTQRYIGLMPNRLA